MNVTSWKQRTHPSLQPVPLILGLWDSCDERLALWVFRIRNGPLRILLAFEGGQGGVVELVVEIACND